METTSGGGPGAAFDQEQACVRWRGRCGAGEHRGGTRAGDQLLDDWTDQFDEARVINELIPPPQV